MMVPFKKKKAHKSRAGKIGLTLKAHNIDTVIDVGANRGQTYSMLRDEGRFEGHIISVEPQPDLQALLQPRAARDDLWTVLPPLALGDEAGELEINISEADDMSSFLPSSRALMQALPKTQVIKTAKVPLKTLDQLYEELELDGKNVFIKIDTQGYEMKILSAAEKTLNSIKGIQIEMSLFELYEGETLYDEIIAFLKNYGFQAHMMIETNFSRKLNRQLQVDGIFYKD